MDINVANFRIFYPEFTTDVVLDARVQFFLELAANYTDIILEDFKAEATFNLVAHYIQYGQMTSTDFGNEINANNQIISVQVGSVNYSKSTELIKETIKNSFKLTKYGSRFMQISAQQGAIGWVGQDG